MTRRYLISYLFFFATALIGVLIAFALSTIPVRPSVVLIGLLAAAVIPAVFLWVLAKMGYGVSQPVTCPRCGTEMPVFRKPESFRQAMWGGYRCPNCSALLDARGGEIAGPTKP